MSTDGCGYFQKLAYLFPSPSDPEVEDNPHERQDTVVWVGKFSRDVHWRDVHHYMSHFVVPE